MKKCADPERQTNYYACVKQCKSVKCCWNFKIFKYIRIYLCCPLIKTRFWYPSTGMLAFSKWDRAPREVRNPCRMLKINTARRVLVGVHQIFKCWRYPLGVMYKLPWMWSRQCFMRQLITQITWKCGFGFHDSPQINHSLLNTNHQNRNSIISNKAHFYHIIWSLKFYDER